MKCPHCNALIEKRWFICPSCGLDLTGEEIKLPEQKPYVLLLEHPSPEAVHTSVARQLQSRQWLVLLTIGIMVLLVFGIQLERRDYQNRLNATVTKQAGILFMTATKQAEILFITARSDNQSAMATATRQAKDTQATATKKAQIQSATATAYNALSLVPKEISELFSIVHLFELFESVGDWSENTIDGNETEIQNGLLKIRHLNPNALIFENIPRVKMRNFYFQVDARLVEGSAMYSCYGISFRWQDSPNSMYIFYVCEDQTFSVTFWSEITGYEDVTTGWVKSNNIRPEKNRLGVLAQDEDVKLFVNDQLAFSFIDDRTVDVGDIALTVAAFNNSTEATFEFDNVVILK